MKRKRRYVHDNDCLRMCIAYILGLPWQKVPHFVGKYRNRWEWHLWKWLSRRRLTMVKAEGEIGTWAPIPYIAVGPHRRGKDYHAIVYRKAMPEYDPNPRGLPLRRVDRSYLILEPSK